MIDISKLTDKDVGRWVYYVPHHAQHDSTEWERGRIKSWNDTNVFVVYAANGNLSTSDIWKNYTGQSTNPSDLIWVSEVKK